MKNLAYIALLGAVLVSAFVGHAETDGENVARLVSGGSDYDALSPVNALGLSRVTSSAEYLPLALPWGTVAVTNRVEGGAAMADVSPSVTELVMTSSLELGDELFVYDPTRGRYDVFELVASESAPARWQAGRVVYVRGDETEISDGPAAEKTVLARGYGCWLHRPGIAARANKTVYLLGQVRVGELAVTIAAGESARFGQTLIGPPLAGSLHLNASAVDWTGAVKGDEIRLPQTDGTLQTAKYDGTKWVRSYYEKVNGINRLRRDVDPIVPEGQAVWYARSAGQPAFTLTWRAE